MNVYLLFPWCRTFLPFDFLSVLVVRRDAVCLPMTPSWFSLLHRILYVLVYVCMYWANDLLHVFYSQIIDLIVQ